MTSLVLSIESFAQKISWRLYMIRIVFFLLLKHGVWKSVIFRIFHIEACFDSNNEVLRLRSKSIFGPRDTTLIVPKDNFIYLHFKRSGFWGLPTSYFIRHKMKKLDNPLVLDLGAHAGLVSLQALKMNFNKGRVVAVEALPNHYHALVCNFSPEKLVAFSGAITGEDFLSRISIAVDTNNLGNSSLLSDLVSSQNVQVNQTEVDVISKDLLLNEIGISSFILKSDLQGYDAKVLSSFPANFWNSCKAGVIEVNAGSAINALDVSEVLRRIDCFANVSWTPFNIKRLNTQEIYEFWTSKSGQERDLYFW